MIGPYRLLGLLGEGGQGTIYLGEDPAGTRVAVKALHARLAGDERARRLFLRESAIARKVEPYCTARVLAADFDGDRPYIVSEYVEGESLSDLVRRAGPRDHDSLQRLAIGTAAALNGIHRAGIVHRDFKPSNVLLAIDGPRVIDFGIARALTSTTTLSGGIVGTPAYMSPEQAAGEAEIGPPSDVFSWAVTLTFAATGVPVFGEDFPGVLNRIRYVQPDLTAMPPHLRDLLAACLDKVPERRPTMAQVLAELLGEGPSVRSNAPAPSVSGPPPVTGPSSIPSHPASLPPGTPVPAPPPSAAAWTGVQPTRTFPGEPTRSSEPLPMSVFFAGTLLQLLAGVAIAIAAARPSARNGLIAVQAVVLAVGALTIALLRVRTDRDG
ncbi:MAG: serine/threonine protein kinase [Actinomadura rubrobrunea]|nr:serine/threonine protein kinase [Actinomadura rubrobrunea]